MRIKTAIILAGGKGTRMRPYLARPINKHLASIGGKPMIHYPIATAVSAKVERIIIMLNGQRPGMILEEVGSEVAGVPVLYHYDRSPVKRGPAAHLAALKAIIQNDEPFLLILGDSVYKDSLPIPTQQSKHNILWAMPVSSGWDDISKYAQIQLAKSGRVTKINRTQKRWANHIQTGAWLFQPSVIELVQRMLQKRDTELRITDVVAELVRNNSMYAQTIAPESFLDVGTPQALKQAERMLARTPALATS